MCDLQTALTPFLNQLLGDNDGVTLAPHEVPLIEAESAFGLLVVISALKIQHYSTVPK
jgi:hypothetical protein